MDEFFEIALKILAEQLELDLEEIEMDTTFEEIDADSIDLIEMIMALEDIYDVEFPEEDLEGYSTIGSLLTALYNYIKQAKDE